MGDGLSNWFSQLDASIQGAVIGAGSAVAATLISVLVTAAVTWLQLRHDRSQKDADRSFELKKDILFESAFGAAECVSVIADLSNFDIDTNSLGARFNEGARKTGLIDVVARPRTIAARNALMQAVTKKFFELLPRRMQLSHLKIEDDIAARKVQGLLDRQNALLQHHQDALLDEKEGKAILASNLLDQVFSQFDDAQREAELASNNLMIGRLPFVQECIESQQELHGLRISFIHALRVELGSSDINDKEFFDAASVDSEALLEAMEEGLQPLRFELERDRQILATRGESKEETGSA